MARFIVRVGRDRVGAVREALRCDCSGISAIVVASTVVCFVVCAWRGIRAAHTALIVGIICFSDASAAAVIGDGAGWSVRDRRTVSIDRRIGEGLVGSNGFSGECAGATLTVIIFVLLGNKRNGVVAGVGITNLAGLPVFKLSLLRQEHIYVFPCFRDRAESRTVPILVDDCLLNGAFRFMSARHVRRIWSAATDYSNACCGRVRVVGLKAAAPKQVGSGEVRLLSGPIIGGAAGPVSGIGEMLVQDFIYAIETDVPVGDNGRIVAVIAVAWTTTAGTARSQVLCKVR